MPEGPELHLASLFVNRVCAGLVFSGPVEKSEVSKNSEVPFTCDAYCITATSRGKEVRLTLTPIKEEGEPQASPGGKACQPMDIVFRFGMSGFFRFTAGSEIPKHAHLRFYTNETPRRALSFVDVRRFGSWEPNGDWQTNRGPCIMFEYQSFRANVLSNLSDRAFDKPICEAMLNQKYFNGIGNYLRAEILYRLKIPPFMKARTVLDGLLPKKRELLEVKPGQGQCQSHQDSEMSLSQKIKVQMDSQDFLDLCHSVPMEVINLGGKGYDPEKPDDYSMFQAWMQCYCVLGMKSLRDHNGRTIWFQGEPGPLAPKVSKSPKAKRKGKSRREDKTDKQQGVKEEPPAKGIKKEKGGAQKRVKSHIESKKMRENERKGSRSSEGRKKKSKPEKDEDAPGTAVPRRQLRRSTRTKSKDN
ncbi:endonuclease 8-like 1 isoform X1 [Polyodon spathula]|uniref:endonuclease 8-like 1 isoform X1 n=1 Tax=Polyodon spathula TaxID=7913 RepID=UPI001B7DEFF5|nr:endonuclease 8-like 1 isoform X1 [Polyodon spathula]